MFGRGGKTGGARIEPRLNWRDESAGYDLRADPADRPPAGRRTKNASSRPASRSKRAGRPRRSLLGHLVYWGFVLSIWGLISLAALIAYNASQLPPIDQLAVPKRPPNIAVLADDGSLIANRGDTGGPAVRLIDLPPYLPKAFVAIEDRRFYEHFGIDPVGVSRALLRDVTGASGHRRRLDADPAARQKPVPDAGAHALAQDPGGDPGAVARAQVFQGSDPRALSEPRLLRFGRLWRRGRGAEIFRQERAIRDAVGSRAARGPDEVADEASAQPQPRGRQRARRAGHNRDGRTGPYQRGDGQARARQPGASQARQKRGFDQLRRRLRDGRARRHRWRDRRGHRGDDHDRSQDAGRGRAGADRRAQCRRAASSAWSKARWWRSIPPARSRRWSADAIMPTASSTARLRPSASPARRSSPSSIWRRWRRASPPTRCARTRRSRSKGGARRTTRANISVL